MPQELVTLPTEAVVDNTWPALPSDLEVIERCSKLTKPVNDVEALGKRFVKIESQTDADAALEYVRSVSIVEKFVEAQRTTYTARPNAFLKALNGTIKPFKDKLEAARKRVAALVLAYDEEQKRIKAAAEKAEREKREAEALERAQRMQEAGNTEAADKLLDIAATAPAPKRQALRSSSGIGTRTTEYWKGEVINVTEFMTAYLKGAFGNHIAPGDITVSARALNAWAKENQGKDVLNGVKITCSKSLGTL